MRVLIVADVHGNLEALESVVADAEERGGFDQVWSLGDVVGYGPSPGECIDLLGRFDTRAIAGNHDLAAIGKMSPQDFNDDALAAIVWTTTKLSDAHKSYLEGLPLTQRLDGFTLAHGSPRDPTSEYLKSVEAVVENLPYFNTARLLVGHTHVSFVCRTVAERATFFKFPVDEPVALGNDRLVINPGAVGQPRDMDPTASYAIYDLDEGAITHHRVKYDVLKTQQKMTEQELPKYLIERIGFGI